MLCKKFANCPVSKDYCHKIDYSALNGLSKDAKHKLQIVLFSKTTTRTTTSGRKQHTKLSKNKHPENKKIEI